MRWCANLHAGLASLLLTGASRRALEAQVSDLTARREAAAAAETAALRRLERDIHDGPQQRLVRLGMDLSAAERRLADDPEAAARLLAEARAQAAETLAELRALSRGIAPPILADRGLAAAVATLAARSPVPTTVDVELAERPAPPVESAAYFVVSEALANVAKHAGPAPPSSAPGWWRRRAGARSRSRWPTTAWAAPRSRRATAWRASPTAWPAWAASSPCRAPTAARRSCGPPCPGPEPCAAGRPARLAVPGARRGTPLRGGHRARQSVPMRILLAEDSVLLREGLVRLLTEAGHEVVAAVDDATAIVPAAIEHAPDVAVVDVRMPPTFTDDGLRAAVELRRRLPGVGVLLLSQYVEESYARDLLADGSGGVGYLLKDRVQDLDALADALARVAAGGTALDPDVVAQLVVVRRTADPQASLTPREREVLVLMAEGRSNAAIAEALVVSPGAVEKHVGNVFAKLGLEPSDSDHRRVLAVLTWLRARTA